MARLIQKTGFISRKSAGGYMKYIATREGVEVLTGKGPATEKQKEMVAKLLKDFPDVRDSFEYEDYKQAPTLHTRRRSFLPRWTRICKIFNPKTAICVTLRRAPARKSMAHMGYLVGKTMRT